MAAPGSPGRGSGSLPGVPRGPHRPRCRRPLRLGAATFPSGTASGCCAPYADVGIRHNDEEHAKALATLDGLLDVEPQPGTPEADELQLLALVIEAYEKARWPIGLPDSVDAIRFCMDRQGLTRRDLEPCIGSRARVSEVLSGKRTLSMRMIRALRAGLDVPLEALVQEPRRGRRA